LNGRAMNMDLDDQSAEEDYDPDDVGEEPPPDIGPRHAADQGEKKRRTSGGEQEFRRTKEAPRQSRAKRHQAKANQADPVRSSPTPHPLPASPPSPSTRPSGLAAQGADLHAEPRRGRGAVVTCVTCPDGGWPVLF
jgi:hypothetical protein